MIQQVQERVLPEIPGIQAMKQEPARSEGNDHGSTEAKV